MRALGLVLLLSGCAQLFSLEPPQRTPDASTGHADASHDAPSGTWRVMPGPALTMGEQPTAPADLAEIYFVRNGRIMRLDPMTRGTSPVTELARADAKDSYPELTADGLVIYFASDRDAGAGETNVWTSTRASRSSPWQPPQAFSATAPFKNVHPGCLTADRLRAVISVAIQADYDLFEAQRDEPTGEWSTIVPQEVSMTATADFSPCITSDGLEVYFSSDRAQPVSIYRAQRTAVAAQFSGVARVGELEVVGSGVRDPWVAPDHRTMLFTSVALAEPLIYMATR